MDNRENMESEMRFMFDEERVFLLEDQPFFARMQDVRACDFITLQKRKTESEWLPPLQEALRKRAKSLRAAFRLQDVFVTNEAGAARDQSIKSQL